MDTNQLPVPDEIERPLPYSIEAERAVIGAVLLEEAAMDDVYLLKPAAFTPGHRKIFSVLVELYEAGDPIDLVSIATRLQEKAWLEQVGGIPYVTQLAGAVPTAANVGHYIKIVEDMHTKRKLIEEARFINEIARADADAAEIISSTQAKLDKLTDETNKKGFRDIGKIAMDCFEQIEMRWNNRDGTGVTGIPSGFVDLDRMTAGFQRSDLIIVGARPSVGKTAFALNVSRNAAKEKGEQVAVFSLEMSEHQLVQRMLSAEANIEAGSLRTGHLVGDDWENLSMAIGAISEFPIAIDDTPGITISEIRSKCRKLKKERGISLVIIDYLQLIEGTRRSQANRTQEISEISRDLKKLAKELDVPIIALSQLSRGVEQRQDKRPMLSDLRESGSIEQDADVVAFLYRDDYYDKETEKKNIIEIIIAKQRNGPVGTVELVFLKQFNKFVSLDRSNVGARSEKHREEEKFKRPDMFRGS